MSKYRYKIAASQPNIKSASLANGCIERSSQANGCRYRINIVNQTRNSLIFMCIYGTISVYIYCVSFGILTDSIIVLFSMTILHIQTVRHMLIVTTTVIKSFSYIIYPSIEWCLQIYIYIYIRLFIYWKIKQPRSGKPLLFCLFKERRTHHNFFTFLFVWISI